MRKQSINYEQVTFKQSYIRKEAKFDDIHDWIDFWHEGQSEKSLVDFLGLTEKEYGAFVMKGDDYLKSLLDLATEFIHIGDYVEGLSKDGVLLRGWVQESINEESSWKITIDQEATSYRQMVSVIGIQFGKFIKLEYKQTPAERYSYAK